MNYLNGEHFKMELEKVKKLLLEAYLFGLHDGWRDAFEEWVEKVTKNNVNWNLADNEECFIDNGFYFVDVKKCKELILKDFNNLYEGNATIYNGVIEIINKRFGELK